MSRRRGEPSAAGTILAAGTLLVVVVAAAAAPAYRDVTASSGVDFVHSNGATGEKNYFEVMGSGVCLLDHDGDSRLDVYFVTSVGTNRLFRNLGGLRFEDVTERAGVGDEGYGMGAVAGDVDNDGDPDLFVTNYGPNRLYRNRGDGSFREEGVAAGVANPLWGSGAVFFDYDRDGLLDLYVVNYVHVANPDTNVCPADDGTRLYCAPRRYPQAQDVLYRNRGDGTFEDVSERAGIAGHPGRGLGVVATDFDRDGWPDLYVANDLDPNFLFHNRGDGTFEEVGVLTGTSHSEDGVEESGMGVAAGDYDNDGWIDLFVSNYVDETNTLYHNEGVGFFLDESATSGLGPRSLFYIGWATDFLDFDLDGRVDIFIANGHTESDAEKVDPTTSWKQRDSLYRNLGNGRFEDVTAVAAPDLLEPRAGRGGAFGDLDDDGDPDIVLVNQNGPALLLENVSEAKRWIGFRLQGDLRAGGALPGRSSRDAVGARVEIHGEGMVKTREVQAGAGYLSCNDLRPLFGLGSGAAIDSVVVQWPSGCREVRRDPGSGRYHVLREGK